jgi:hypothetical protein
MNDEFYSDSDELEILPGFHEVSEDDDMVSDFDDDLSPKKKLVHDDDFLDDLDDDLVIPEDVEDDDF